MMSNFSLEMEEASLELTAHLPWVSLEKSKLQEPAGENKWGELFVPMRAHEIMNLT